MTSCIHHQIRHARRARDVFLGPHHFHMCRVGTTHHAQAIKIGLGFRSRLTSKRSLNLLPHNVLAKPLLASHEVFMIVACTRDIRLVSFKS